MLLWIDSQKLRRDNPQQKTLLFGSLRRVFFLGLIWKCDNCHGFIGN
ncbi:hypothetical protein VP120E341_P0028 [Vibrio phage 120E34-1]|nr:hypothetical protein VP120E341_P0028 [Vibrio phage 120E34-1]